MSEEKDRYSQNFNKKICNLPFHSKSFIFHDRHNHLNRNKAKWDCKFQRNLYFLDTSAKSVAVMNVVDLKQVELQQSHDCYK